MKKLLLLVLPLFALLAAGCDDKIDLNLNTTEPYLDVDGTIDDRLDTRDTIRLLSTIAYLNQNKLPPIPGATVILLGDNGLRVTLKEVKPGYYCPPDSFAGIVGVTYTLDIATLDGETFQSSATMPRPEVLDSITQIEKKDNPPYRDGAYVGLWYNENPGKGDNTMFEVVKNDTLQDLPQELFAFNDDLADGANVRGTIINRRPYKRDDRIQISVISITEDALNFINELQVQIDNGGLFSQPPANVRTNVRNTRSGSKKRVIGYFTVRSVSTKSIVIR